MGDAHDHQARVAEGHLIIGGEAAGVPALVVAIPEGPTTPNTPNDPYILPRRKWEER